MNRIVTISIVALLAASCQKKSGNIWEDNQTGAKYSHQNSASLWGSKNSSSQEELIGPVDEEFLPLSDEDLKSQFAEHTIPQGKASLGEGGVPTEAAFFSPAGELAAFFRPVFFNTDEHVLKVKEYVDNVSRMAEYLKSHPQLSVIIEGHCDARGPEAYNMALGAKRANAIRAMLVNLGVNPNQLHTISYGKEKPFVQGNGPDVWSQNRRAHFRVHG